MGSQVVETNDRLLSPSETDEQEFEHLKRLAKETTSIMRDFWNRLPEDMPPELRSDITMMWFIAAFMEGKNNG